MKSPRQAITAVLLVAVCLCAGLVAQAPKPTNPLEQLLQTAFATRNPKVTRTKVLELRSIGMGHGGYILLGWGIRPDMKFEGSFDDELFGVFLLDNQMTRIERVIDMFPTCRWADCIVSIERMSWSASEVVVVGAGSYGDQAFRKTYKIGPSW
jgi:hypothetical protein